MTRQMFYVFFGERRDTAHTPHESPAVMTVPLVVLAVCAVLLEHYRHAGLAMVPQLSHGPRRARAVNSTQACSPHAAFDCSGRTGDPAGWWLYGRRRIAAAEAPDPLETLQPDIFTLLRNKFWIDELYDKRWFA